ncbi:nicotinate-nucleotide adenylyltransferase [Mycoplasma testudineum]|uniref:Probable nicotinate-nucleotide adenylyltransferase n=1 Tax=Mycoplasma testudineum TaxID=244584 RepID=A0A4R6IFP8_9MOLU|nr:nicotinate-nucleotide adenylyltransferase [Mycoplasma testudineum]OYD27003.1 nicotinate (nicotinamide) nucleotide adenylyltransferase [Mycoplasma testudineum]TDO20551.1 nicotinate-nucleotide adenylyltransferase [Mycoplasma testudineum]
MSVKEKVIIFGGTFDPIHFGHLKMAEYAKSEIKPDRFIWLPTGTNPFKKGKKITTSEHRLKMLKMAIDKNDEISEFETNRRTISYTKDSIKYFKSIYPNADIYFLIGSDLLTRLHKWEEIQWISEQVTLLVARRSSRISKVNLKKYNARLLNNEVVEFSSTDVKHGIYDLVPNNVQKYFAKNYLYLEEYLRKCLSVKRSKHSFATAEFAGQLAKDNGLEWNTSYYAGLLHDVAKEWENDVHRELINKYYDIKFENLETHKYHQISGALWYKYIYKGENEKIYKAILNHTTLENTPLSIEDKIVFIADKISEGRKFNGIQKLRNLVKSDLENGFKSLLKINLNFLKEKNVASEKIIAHYERLING